MTGFGQTFRGLLASVILAGGVFAAWTWRVPHDVRPVDREVSPPTVPVRPANDRRATPDQPIRVALTLRPAETFGLRIDGPYRLAPIDGGDGRRFDTALRERSVSAEAGNVVLNGMSFPEGVEIVPEQSPSIWIEGRQYRGTIRLHVATEDRLWAVNVLPLEEYLAAVVDAEMPAAFPPAAREAQAVVARTYAVSCRRNPPRRWFDLYATPVSQNYLGYVYRAGGRLLAGETPAGRDAVAATTGVICTHDGESFRTYYSACCGGRTVSGQAVFDDGSPPLGGAICGECTAAPLFRWEREIDDASAFDRLTKLARTRAPAFGSIRTAKTPVGSNDELPRVTLSDGRRTVKLTPSEVKSALRLPSLHFDLSGDSRRLLVRGRGHGHGVGLCQWGAKGLAERGMTAEQILKRYYPGCELTSLSDRPPAVAQR